MSEYIKLTNLLLQQYNISNSIELLIRGDIMSKIDLYHGSPNILEKPLFGHGKTWNDYGPGFYCTEHKELAKEWAVSDASTGFANKYTLETKDLLLLNLGDYTMLHWLAVLVQHRKFQTTTPIMKRGKDYLKAHFYLPVENYDLIRGYRADDSYFSFAKAFLTNQISYMQLSYAMKLGKLGEQVVLKSKKSFERIKFKDYELADYHEYFPKKKVRDEKARSNYRKLLEEDDIEGLFMRDILREEIKADDSRLQ